MKQSLKEVLQNNCSWGPVAKFKEKTDAATRGVLYKKVFLKILQNSQENTCTRVSFFIKLQGLGLQLYQKRDSGTGVLL